MTDWEKYSKEELGQKIEEERKENEDLREYIRFYLVGDKKSALIAKLKNILKKRKNK